MKFNPLWFSTVVAVTLFACSGGEGADGDEGTGGGDGDGDGTFSSGGLSGVGGGASSGGLTGVGGGSGGLSGVGGLSTGGDAATGGAPSGGGPGSGGEAATGGAPGSGGAPSGGAPGVGGTPVQLDADITIDPDTRYQTIDGFGAALPMWVGSANGMLTQGEVRSLVGMGDNELGLSIVRTIIEPDSGKWSYAVSNLQEAKSYGSEVQILGSPWSPPAGMKSNGSTTNGGKLLTNRYGDYATHLNDYVQYMAGQGVTIDVVSVQNEPDWHPDYDSCDWTGTELRNFVRDHGNSITGTKLLVGESLRFDRAYTDPTLNDTTAANNMDLVGGHLYSAESYGFFTAYPLAEQKGKGRWMTEWLSHEADGDGAAIWGGENQAVWDETLDVMLRSVHISMDVNWNAYIWWWARRFYSFIGDGEAQFGTTKSQVLKRGWAFSHYAKFVRPGFSRVQSSASGFSFLNLTAFEGDDQVVAVLLNRSNDSYTDVVFEIPDTVTSAEAYVTSRTSNRAETDVEATGTYAVLASLPARSVVTVVMNY